MTSFFKFNGSLEVRNILLIVCLLFVSNSFPQSKEKGLTLGWEFGGGFAAPVTTVYETGTQSGFGMQIPIGYQINNHFTITIEPMVFISDFGFFDNRDNELTKKIYRNSFMLVGTYYPYILRLKRIIVFGGTGLCAYSSYNKPAPALIPPGLPSSGIWGKNALGFRIGIGYDFRLNERLFLPVKFELTYSNLGKLKYESYTTGLAGKLQLLTLPAGIRFMP